MQLKNKLNKQTKRCCLQSRQSNTSHQNGLNNWAKTCVPLPPWPLPPAPVQCCGGLLSEGGKQPNGHNETTYHLANNICVASASSSPARIDRSNSTISMCSVKVCAWVVSRPRLKLMRAPHTFCCSRPRSHKKKLKKRALAYQHLCFTMVCFNNKYIVKRIIHFIF